MDPWVGLGDHIETVSYHRRHLLAESSSPMNPQLFIRSNTPLNAIYLSLAGFNRINKST